MSTRNIRAALVAIAAAIAVSACGGSQVENAPPKLTSAPVGEQPHPDWPADLGQGSARFVRIDLGPDSFRECQRISPKFPFDSEQTYAQDQQQIAALASCLNSNEMKDRTIVLVGRADPRGTGEYNAELGMKRALAIEWLLIEAGIAPERVSVVSEGKKGALGDQPDWSYGYDRRVDVIVRGGTHQP